MRRPAQGVPQLLTARLKGGMSQSWSLSIPSWMMAYSVTGTGGPLGDLVFLKQNNKKLRCQSRKPYQGSVHFLFVSKQRNRRVWKSHSCSQCIRDSFMDLGIKKTGKEGLRTVCRERRTRRWRRGIAGLFYFQPSWNDCIGISAGFVSKVASCI